MKPCVYILMFSLLLISCGQSVRHEAVVVKEKTNESEDPSGEYLYAKYTCIACHSLKGQSMYGPPLNTIYMKNVEVVRDGKNRNLVADREYLERAIKDPDFERVKGGGLSNFQ